jgi:hypothetical protein
VFIALTLTLVFLAIGAFTTTASTPATGNTLDHIGGYLGILTAVLAWYGSFATVINATWKRVVLPVMPAK